VFVNLKSQTSHLTNSSSSNALLATALKRETWFLYCYWWNSSTGNLNFIHQVLQYSYFIFFKRTQCSLEYPTDKIVKVLSQEIGMDTPHILFFCYPCSAEANIEKVSNIGVVIRWRTVTFTVKSLHQNTEYWFKAGRCGPALLHRLYLWQSFQGKIALTSVWKTYRGTLVSMVNWLLIPLCLHFVWPRIHYSVDW
jgi:hypothetical protein